MSSSLEISPTGAEPLLLANPYKIPVLNYVFKVVEFENVLYNRDLGIHTEMISIDAYLKVSPDSIVGIREFWDIDWDEQMVNK